VPGWGLAAGSGGDGQHFASYVNYAGGTAYRFASGDAAFTLLKAGGGMPTDTPTQTPTATPTSTPTATPTSIPCVGDCDANHQVTVDELVTGASMTLGSAQRDLCPAFDCSGNGRVTIGCVVQAADAALNGCPPVVQLHFGKSPPDPARSSGPP
jgi:hypothetical protein